MQDEIIGSDIVKNATVRTISKYPRSQNIEKKATLGSKTLTRSQNKEIERVCKTRIAMKLVKYKNGNTYKVWWCRKANGKMKIVKFRKVVSSNNKFN